MADGQADGLTDGWTPNDSKDRSMQSVARVTRNSAIADKLRDAMAWLI